MTIDESDGKAEWFGKILTCSECKTEFMIDDSEDKRANYCPNCGNHKTHPLGPRYPPSKYEGLTSPKTVGILHNLD